ncbi:hypothetical protein [Microvirga sp. BSC39]|nr:hypothetical protein [Microvirga sp. BSC39]
MVGIGILLIFHKLRIGEDRTGFLLRHKDLALAQSSKVSFILFAGFP